MFKTYDAVLNVRFRAEFRDLYERAVKEVLAEQAELGIDVVTDGELDRESYVWFLW